LIDNTADTHKVGLGRFKVRFLKVIKDNLTPLTDAIYDTEK